MKKTNPMEYMHIEYGYIVTYDEMMQIMREDYDMDDTNICDWHEYFTKIGFDECGNIIAVSGE